ncbi:MAG: SpoIID/LytB domain-containing protein [Pyrinomonadaceae bacterium]|nr:SpoIID/LytB domain-containing protein [Pyrinomonadaceae bacterium]
MKKQVLWSLASLLVLVCVGQSFAQRSSRSDRQLEEDFIRSRVAVGDSHASGNRPELGPVNLSTPSAVVVSLRVGLYANTFNGTGGIATEFSTLNHQSVQLTNTEGSVAVIDLSTGDTIASMQAGELYTVSFNGTNYVVVSPTATYNVVGPVRFVPSIDTNLFTVESILRNALGVVQKPKYRGEIEIARGTTTAAGAVNLVNIIEVEKYVRGVVANESIASFHMEALRAQAVAARGYAIANRGRYVGLGYPFDIVDSSSSQVYRGYLSEHARAVQATDESTGLVATYNGSIISALYSSSFGGYSDSNHWIFNIPSTQLPGTNVTPFLTGIFDGEGTAPDLTDPAVRDAFWKNIVPEGYDMCGRVNNRFSRWKVTIPSASIKSRLTGNRYVLISGDISGTITGVSTLLRMTGSNRIAIEQITLTSGVVEVRGWDNLRNVFGRTVNSEPAVCPNSSNIAANFTLTNPGLIESYYDGSGGFGGVIAYGGGWGHNVGMSQYGANGRGLAGQSFLQILKAYYTGVEIGTYPITVDPKLDVAGRTQSIYVPGNVAYLIVKPYRMKRLDLQINGTYVSYWFSGLPGSTITLDISQYVVQGLNTIEYDPIGAQGQASVQIVVD